MQLLIIPDWTTLTDDRRGKLDALSGRLSDLQIRHFFALNASVLTKLLNSTADRENLLVFVDEPSKEGEAQWAKPLSQAGIQAERWKRIGELEALSSETIQGSLEGWIRTSAETARRPGRPEK